MGDTMRLILAAAFAIVSFQAAANDLKELFARLIRSHGFQCPTVESATSFGNDHYGKVVKMSCGQGDNRGNPIYFRVTEVGTLPNVDYRIEPWHD
jgi:hypothetical protein